MKHDFWKNKKVLITGHTGFKGAWLTLLLKKLKADLCGISLAPTTDPNLFSLAKIETLIDSHICDIRDQTKLQKIINDFQPEIVFHLAAQPLVGYSYKHPHETYTTNVIGTLNVLEAIRHCKSIKTGIMITTDKCYENKEWVWGYREIDRLGGHDPYSSSKAAAEILIKSYRDSYFSHQGNVVAIASARAGNVIGGGDWAEDRLIPDIINAMLNNKPILLRNPDAIRPWQHVLDPLNAYLNLAEACYTKPSYFSDAWNFGPSYKNPRDVRWITEKMATLWNKDIEINALEASPYKETTYLKLDCAKAHSELSWALMWDIDETLKHIVDWYKAFENGDDMQNFSFAQIDMFINQAS